MIYPVNKKEIITKLFCAIDTKKNKLPVPSEKVLIKRRNTGYFSFLNNQTTERQEEEKLCLQ